MIDMSMISAQIDELRAIADKDTVPYEASDAMYQAADTIWQLRDDLQRTNAENAKLRGEYNKMDVWHSKELTAAMDENAKLRELCRRALVVLENNCSQCVYFYECDIVNDCKCVAPMHIRNELHELGIEVDG